MAHTVQHSIWSKTDEDVGQLLNKNIYLSLASIWHPCDKHFIEMTNQTWRTNMAIQLQCMQRINKYGSDNICSIVSKILNNDQWLNESVKPSNVKSSLSDLCPDVQETACYVKCSKRASVSEKGSPGKQWHKAHNPFCVIVVRKWMTYWNLVTAFIHTWQWFSLTQVPVKSFQ